MNNLLKLAASLICMAVATNARGQERPTLLDANGGVERIAFLTESSLIGYSSGDRAKPATIMVWKVDTKTPVQVQSAPEFPTLRTVLVSRDGKRILVCHDPDFGVPLTVNWDLGIKNEGRATASVKKEILYALSPNGKLAVLRTSELVFNTFLLREADAFKELGRLPLEVASMNGEISLATSLAFTPDNKYLLVSYRKGSPNDIDYKKGVHVFDLATRKAVRTLGTGGKELNFIKVDPTGKRLAVLTDNMTVSVFDLQNWQLVSRFQPGEKGILSLDFNHNGSRLAVVALGEKTIDVVICDPDKGKNVCKLEGMQDLLPMTIVFSAAGDRLAATCVTRGQGFPCNKVLVWAVSADEAPARTPLAGPRRGKLVIKPPPETFVAADRAGVKLSDCVVEATFIVPAIPPKGIIWSEGFFFRMGGTKNLGALVNSDGTWEVGGYGFEAKGAWRVMETGKLPAGVLATKKGDRNRVKVILDGKKGKLFLNDSFVTDFDASEQLAPGDVAAGFNVATNVALREALEALYEDFRVYALR